MVRFVVCIAVCNPSIVTYLHFFPLLDTDIISSLVDIVRMLSESMTGPIDMDNLEIAKEVLRRKFIIGLLDNKRGSFARFDHYFKWKDRYDELISYCSNTQRSSSLTQWFRVPTCNFRLYITVPIMRRNSVVVSS